MSNLSRLTIVCLLCAIFSYSNAQRPGELVIPSDASFQQRAAGCAPATAIRDLEWNNVRARLETGGNMWQDRAAYSAAYEVPKGVGVSVVFAAALWMGGISPDQQLKCAAVRFREQGNDYWPGPLSNDGAAEISEDQCEHWDRFFISERTDSQRHLQYYNCLNDPECDLSEEFESAYNIPEYFASYPAHGNPALNQDFYLAPFYDYNDDGNYDPQDGDYPWYDFLQEINCAERRRDDAVPLFGDQTYYWIFNDKGNVHSESQGEPIGMEIRAQAFAFSTNDEINNMTFYNYVLINQGTQTLGETYFGSWVECDVGGHTDDYVGCDVQRGLGYAYNGDGFDEPTGLSLGYGENPPAFGVDFFEGPFQDEDNQDNPLVEDFIEATDNGGIPYRGIGIGYGDGVVDNERFGMRKFVFFNYNNGPNGPPTLANDYYNYMRGFWKNGQRMSYGGDGLTTSSGTNLDIPANYMFPGDTDPVNWGTEGVSTEPWTEQTSGNPSGDRSFIQSAGPFVLEPGDYNNITLGVVYARATAGDPFESVELVRVADDKAQALFDNCFEIVSGPDAPDVAIQELDQELILYLSNDNPLSNNYKESYLKFDPSIPEALANGISLDSLERSYEFQGYQVYQLANANVAISDLNDIDQSRLILQMDIEDDISTVINYTFDPDLGLPVPTLMSEGANEGLQHSFSVTEDAFAQGSNALVNHKTYYFVALAYGFNNFREYNPVEVSGQPEQYKASRKAAIGSIRVYSGIPHKSDPEAGGTIASASYGDGVQITRLEGKGNGDNVLEITAASEEDILANNVVPAVTYEAGMGPVNIKVVDPLNLPAADFDLKLAPDSADIEDGDEAFWVLTNLTTGEQVTSQKAIAIENEELLLDWGLSITWVQYEYTNFNNFTRPLSSYIEFEDPTKPWLLGINDQEGFTELNWIRSGNQEGAEDVPEEQVFNDTDPGNPMDEEELYESIVSGTWAPFPLVSYTDEIVPSTSNTNETQFLPVAAPTTEEFSGPLSIVSRISHLNNVDVVITNDKSKWTRCPVLEMQPIENLAEKTTGDEDPIDPEKMRLRRAYSVDKNGRNAVNQGGNPDEANLVGNIGMGWFPGYAIDVGTGERLNMAFGEDSWLGAENGNDMIWNPSPNLESSLGSSVYAGGQHWVYVFKNSSYEENRIDRVPAYDSGAFLYQMLETEFSASTVRRAFRSCTWVGSSLLNDDYSMLSVEDGLIPNDARIRLRVGKKYEKYTNLQLDWEDTLNYQFASNLFNPHYTFSTKSIATQTSSNEALISALDCINVVPNPYYAYSEYEVNKLDNRVKITNLPEVCTVTIYNVSGTLVRQYKKADPLTSLDWDLKNENNIPIAGGVYIIHIDVPDVGEKVLKWFGVMRPVDLDNF